MLRFIWRLARPWVEFWNELLGDPLKWKPQRKSAPAPTRPRESAPAMVYVEWDSPGRADIEKLLQARNIRYQILAVDHDEATRSWLAATVQRDPPVVFIGGEVVGDLADLRRLDASGELVRRVFGTAPSEKPVQVYGRKSDTWTNRVTDLLDSKQASYDFIDLDDPKQVGVAERLVGETRQNLTPYVFIRGRYVGGFNTVDELDRLGQLDDLLAGRDAHDVAPGRPRIVVEIADRPPGEPN